MADILFLVELDQALAQFFDKFILQSETTHLQTLGYCQLALEVKRKQFYLGNLLLSLKLKYALKLLATKKSFFQFPDCTYQRQV